MSKGAEQAIYKDETKKANRYEEMFKFFTNLSNAK